MLRLRTAALPYFTPKNTLKMQLPRGFYLLFSLAVTASVQLVGVYLVFSSRIMPALAVRRGPENKKLIGGYGIGVRA